MARSRRPGLSDGSPALVRDRLDTFASAFLADARPGLVFEFGRLVLANDAARRLFRDTEADDDFLLRLKDAIEAGRIEPDLLLRTRSGAYAPVLQPARSPKGHPTRICFLVRKSPLAAAYESLSGRELDVVRFLVKGMSNGEIASELGISVETVRKHVSSALGKTGTRTRAGLVGQGLRR